LVTGEWDVGECRCPQKLGFGDIGE
jgi:hypothetical protein